MVKSKNFSFHKILLPSVFFLKTLSPDYKNMMERHDLDPSNISQCVRQEEQLEESRENERLRQNIYGHFKHGPPKNTSFHDEQTCCFVYFICF